MVRRLATAPWGSVWLTRTMGESEGESEGEGEGSPGDGVSRCTDDELEDLIRFHSRVQPERSRPLDAARIRWLFGANPCRPGDELTMWVCRRGGHIVGTYGAILVDLKVDNEMVPAAWSVDLLVDERWRGSGAAQELADARRQALGQRTYCALGISEAGHRFALRRGFVDMPPMSTYVWLADPSRLWHGTAPRLARMVRPLARAAVAPAYGLCRLRSRRIELVPIQCFDERADTLWCQLAPSYPALARRDTECLRWRFDSCPDSASYQRWYVSIGGLIVGYVVTQTLLRSEEPFLSIVDYLVAPHHLGALFGSVALRARAAGATGVVCRSLHLRANRALRSLGYVKRRQDVRFMVMSRDNDPLRPVLLDASSWFATGADSDVN